MRKSSEQKERKGRSGLALLAVVGAGAVVYRDEVRHFFAAVRHSLMDSARRVVQQTLSRMLDARVEFGHMDLSPAGRLEIRDLTVTAHDAAEPILRVGRFVGEIAISKAFAGELDVMDAVLERPVLTIRRDAQGQINLPRLLRIPLREVPQKAEQAAQVADKARGAAEAAGRVGVTLRIERALWVDPQIHYIDDALSGYHLAMSGGAGELRRYDGGYSIVEIVDHVGRRDRRADLGEVRSIGALTNTDNLLHIDQAQLWLDIEAGEGLRTRVDCESLDPPRVTLRVAGDTDVTKLTPMLPDDVPALEPLRANTAQGHVTLTMLATYNCEDGLRVGEMNMSARDVTVGGESSG